MDSERIIARKVSCHYQAKWLHNGCPSVGVVHSFRQEAVTLDLRYSELHGDGLLPKQAKDALDFEIEVYKAMSVRARC